MKNIKSIIDSNKVDYLFCHSHNGTIMLYTLRLRYRMRIPFICTCHGVNPRPSLFQYLFTCSMILIWRSEIVKKIICVENFTPKTLIKFGVPQQKVTTVYNGINPYLRAAKIDLSVYCNKATPIIITASRLTKIKGVDYLLEALKVIKERKLDFHYFCIGNGEEEENLKRQCESLGLSDKVTFMGYQNNVADWLETCDVFVLPSLEEFHSIAILEAMRARKAIVATNIGGNPESLRANIDALMVPSKDSKSLSEALIKMLTSSELRSEMGNNARRRFEDMFTIEAMMSNLAREIMTTK